MSPRDPGNDGRPGGSARREVATLWETPKEAPSRGAPVGVAAAVAFALCASGVLGVWMYERSRRAEVAASAQAARRARVEAERREALARQRAALEEAVERERLAAWRRLEEARVAAEEAARPVAHVTWGATVATATGVTLRPDAPCVLEGSFVARGGDTSARSFTVRCGDEVIYRSTDEAGDGVAAPRVGLREGPVFGSEGHEYMLSYRDEGARTGPRPQATVSTLNHRAAVWRDGANPLRVTLFVRDVSAPREGPALFGGGDLRGRRRAREPSFAGAVERAGRVTAVRGDAPVARGARCTFTARPVWEFPENCRVILRCGQTVVYGEGEAGYLTCAVRGGRATAALDDHTSDNGGDPRLDWRGSRVVVSDFTEAGEWRCEVSF